MENDQPPQGLAEFGRRLWDTVSADRRLSSHQYELLVLACKQADRAAEARRLLTSSEIVGRDRFGQEKPHPAVQIERMASLACAAIVEKIVGKTGQPAAEIDPDAEFFE